MFRIFRHIHANNYGGKMLPEKIFNLLPIKIMFWHCLAIIVKLSQRGVRRYIYSLNYYFIQNKVSKHMLANLNYWFWWKYTISPTFVSFHFWTNSLELNWYLLEPSKLRNLPTFCEGICNGNANKSIDFATGRKKERRKLQLIVFTFFRGVQKTHFKKRKKYILILFLEVRVFKNQLKLNFLTTF